MQCRLATVVVLVNHTAPGVEDGAYTSIAVQADGAPLVAFYDKIDGALAVRVC